MQLRRFMQRGIHFWKRIFRETKRFPHMYKHFGLKIAISGYIDGLIPPGKSQSYIHTVEEYVDNDLRDLVVRYQKDTVVSEVAPQRQIEKFPIWCCWWQGEEQMPELVKMCYTRIKQIVPENKAKLYLITLDNYQDYVSFPEHILKKFQDGLITKTTLSDVLRFQLLYQYGGYWLDATVFFTDKIPEEYFKLPFYCQRMSSNPEKVCREACKGNWCGFSMAGRAGNIVFKYMNDAFSWWWDRHDEIIDYVLIDYLLWTGYRKIPAIKRIIDTVPDNNEDIFQLYQVLNAPYSEELYRNMTMKNVMHKLTYKMDLKKETDAGELTMYGFLYQEVFGK